MEVPPAFLTQAHLCACRNCRSSCCLLAVLSRAQQWDFFYFPNVVVFFLRWPETHCCVPREEEISKIPAKESKGDVKSSLPVFVCCRGVQRVTIYRTSKI